MNKVADKYISESGRRPEYSREDYVEDMLEAASFLCWAEDAGESFAGVDASRAFQAMCRMLDISPTGLRKAIMRPDG